jgi:threonine dehydrogenase-like Zn-dependent dehydrogenase
VNAVVVERPGKVAIQRIDDPTPGPHEALVQVEACGICGTDIHILEGELPPTRYPIVPGHEFCGEVVAVGREFEHLRVGDFVAVDPNLYCGECHFCQAGRTATSADELDRPQGWEVVIDATGVVDAIEDGLGRVARGGTFLVFGVTSAEATATFSPFRIYNEEINVIGSMAVLHSFERARDLLVGGGIDAAAMITHNMALESYQAAIAAFRSGAGLKIQVIPATDGRTR